MKYFYDFSNYFIKLHIGLLAVCIIVDVILLAYINYRKINIKDDYLAFHEKYTYAGVLFLKIILIALTYNHLTSGTWRSGSLMFVAAYCILVGQLLCKVVKHMREKNNEA